VYEQLKVCCPTQIVGNGATAVQVVRLCSVGCHKFPLIFLNAFGPGSRACETCEARHDHPKVPHVGCEKDGLCVPCFCPLVVSQPAFRVRHLPYIPVPVQRNHVPHRVSLAVDRKSRQVWLEKGVFCDRFVYHVPSSTLRVCTIRTVHGKFVPGKGSRSKQGACREAGSRLPRRLHPLVDLVGVFVGPETAPR
jgi:hypothetical protein